MRLQNLLLLLFVCVAGPAVAEPYEEATDALFYGDYATALRLLRPLAEQGHARAQNDLGRLSEKGYDFPAAVSWYRKAADQGHVSAQVSLATMYAAGVGVAQDFVQVHKWSNLAAAQGRADAANLRTLAARQLTPAQLAEAQRLASEWRPRPGR